MTNFLRQWLETVCCGATTVALVLTCIVTAYPSLGADAKRLNLLIMGATGFAGTLCLLYLQRHEIARALLRFVHGAGLVITSIGVTFFLAFPLEGNPHVLSQLITSLGLTLLGFILAYSTWSKVTNS